MIFFFFKCSPGYLGTPCIYQVDLKLVPHHAWLGMIFFFNASFKDRFTKIQLV